jgi:hypothetical protein
LPRKPRRKPTRRSRRDRCIQIGKVRYLDQFLYTFDCLAPDGSHNIVQLVHRNDDVSALRAAKRQFAALGYGHYAYGTYAYASQGYGGSYWYGSYGYAAYGYDPRALVSGAYGAYDYGTYGGAPERGKYGFGW